MSDLISRADAVKTVIRKCSPICAWQVGTQQYPDCVVAEINALPSAETHEIRTETHGVCLISKDDAMGAVQDHFNADGFKGYDDGQKMMDRIKELPSADAVSREECDECKTDKEGVLLQQLAELQGDYETMKNAYEDALADAEWIPCSERLPKEKARVLTYDSMGDIVFGQYDKGRWYWEAEACADYWAKNDGVIAWIPLPTPYKGGDTK